MQIPIADKDLERDLYDVPFYRPDENDEALQYLIERRRELGGPVPERRSKYTQIDLPEAKAYDVVKRGSGHQEVASTMGFVRLLKELIMISETGLS